MQTSPYFFYLYLSPKNIVISNLLELLVNFIIILDDPRNVQLPEKSLDKLAWRDWLHNVVTQFLREFVFDVEESDELIEQVNHLDGNQRECYLYRICCQRYQEDHGDRGKY